MPTTQEPKVPPEKPGPGAGKEKDTGAAAAGTTAGGPKGGVKPQDDDRPPQN